MKTLSIAFSPCPNDTFVFYALAHNILDSSLQFESHLMDIEQLNLCALQQKYDITKMSCLAFGKAINDYVMLRSGAALGKGCGPLLLSRHNRPPKPSDVIGIPGQWTTANLLLKICVSKDLPTKEYSFEEIMPAICSGEIDYGVVIHEGRFTYEEYKLNQIYDLGNLWQEKFSLPIPLGIIAAKRSIPVSIVKNVEKHVKESVVYAYASPEKTQKYIAQNAQEMKQNILSSHIDLYVNEQTKWLDNDACCSIAFLLEKAVELGLVPPFSKNIFLES